MKNNKKITKNVLEKIKNNEISQNELEQYIKNLAPVELQILNIFIAQLAIIKIYKLLEIKPSLTSKK